jgi:hypothetical protein
LAAPVEDVNIDFQRVKQCIAQLPVMKHLYLSQGYDDELNIASATDFGLNYIRKMPS